MSSLLSAELAATCNSLGYLDQTTDKYYADSNTLETVKDLIRYLRRDDETHDIRRQLGETKVVQSDLLPLVKSYWEETDLFDVLLRLLVNLTTPALMLWKEELPTERIQRNYYLMIEDHLRSYKESFADEAVWAVLSTRLSKILEIDYMERGDENSLIIERILILIRNVLYIASDPDAEQRPDNDANIHDQVLWALHQSGMLDIILYITSSSSEQAYYMHILEILSFMLREQGATELASAALQRSETEKLRDEALLLAIRHRETSQKQEKVKKYAGSRHSRFGGTFIVKSMKSIGDNELIYHKPLNRLDSLNFDVDKKPTKTPKNRLPAIEANPERRSAFSVRFFLKEFCVEFLNGSYNVLMHNVKGTLLRAKAQAHDESYYLWALRFFMEFNRSYKFEVKLVSETMSVQSFHYVQQQMENYYDMISSDKKKLKLWSRRLHLALLSYRELLLTICAMEKSSDRGVKDSAHVIKSNVFYVLEYRELVLTLLVNYDEIKMSASYLTDLMETQHVFLKMLQVFCGGAGSGKIVVQGKSKAKRKALKKKKKKTVKINAAPVEFNASDMWDEASSQLSAVLESFTEVPAGIIPFDATSEVPIDEQKVEAMKNVQRKLRSGDYEYGVGLLRASREVWTENDCFGSRNMPIEQEFLALRDIFLADLGENHLPIANAAVENSAEETDEEEEPNEEDEEDELAANMYISESDFKFEDFGKRLAHPKVVRACGLALRNFEKNPPLTNHCIVKLLHRIAFDCKMYVMIFQLSIFRTFQQIYQAKEMPQYKELQKFATFIIRKFITVAKKNELIFMDTLFWKNSREAYDAEEGYGSYQEKNNAANLKIWSEAEEDELRKLFMEHQEARLTDDVVDYVTSNLIDKGKTRRSVLKKLKDMYLLTDYKPGKKSLSLANKHWSSEEEEQLTELYEQYKNDSDPVTCIMDSLEIQRPRNRIIDKLLVMGLVQDKKELYKKRANKSKSGPNQGSNNESTGEDNDSDDDNGSTNTLQQTSRKNTTNKKKKPAKSNRVVISKKELSKLLIGLVESGMSEALDWVRDSLNDALEDLDDNDDIDEGVPLVPLTENAITAMDNEEFLRVLEAVDINKPSDEQETFWRISSRVSPNTMRAHCSILQQAIDRTLVIPADEPLIQKTASSAYEKESSSGDDDDVFDRLKKFTKAPQENSTEIVNSEEPVASTSGLVKKPKKSKARKVVQNKDSSDEEQVEEFHSNKLELNKDVDKEFDNLVTQSKTTNPEKLKNKEQPGTLDSKKKPKSRIKKIVDSDDDDEFPTNSYPGEINQTATTLNIQSDEEFNNSQSHLSKSRRVLASSSSSDSEDLDQRENVTTKVPQVLESVDNTEVSNSEETKRARSALTSDDEKPKPKRTRVIVSDDDD